MADVDPAKPLKEFKPKKKFFVGIDSDSCAFDTEMGKKAQHLDYATKGRYEKNHVLMVGDAPGDMKAAKANDALFYPVNPGDEVKSWKRFHDEAFDRFINGEYAGNYEEKLIAEFDEYLPETPPREK